MPRSLRWNHNSHYQRWLVRSLPAPVGSALDVGCGVGDLPSLLATKANRVDAVDRAPEMIELARKLHPTAATWLLGDIRGDQLPLDPAGYDLVTCVACLHHMPLWAGLSRLTELVRPGGLLVVVGLHRSVSVADFAMGAVSTPADLVMGVRLRRRHLGGRRNYGMPVLDPRYTFAELRTAAADIAPGAVVRRRLYFRHTLVWRRPSSCDE